MKKRVEQEKRLKGKNDNIKVPDFMLEDPTAVEKFNQIVKELEDAEILSNVDVDLLSIYCDCWSKYVNTTKILYYQDMVESQENKSGIITKVQNPYIKIQQTYLDRLIKISSLFGLSPADRSKIAHLNPSSKEEKADPLMELIQGLKG